MANIDQNNSSGRFPFSITPVDAETNEQLLRDFTGEKDGFVQVGPKKYFFPNTFTKHAEQMYTFAARTEDIWISTFPRSGTTMMQEIVWLIANDFDYDRARAENLVQRVPFFEAGAITNEKFIKMHLLTLHDDPIRRSQVGAILTPQYGILDRAESPRVFKTHLAPSLMPSSVMQNRAKFIYVARHPKDVAVSWYHLSRLSKPQGFVDDFVHFWEYFEKDLTMWSPFWEHLKEGWSLRDEPDVLFIFYENLVKDMPGNIRKVAAFLNKEISDEQVERLADHMKVENFKKNSSVNFQHFADCGLWNDDKVSFIRRGQVSGEQWQNEYTPELTARAEAWIEKNLRETKIEFPE